jgi:hypothetical protein
MDDLVLCPCGHALSRHDLGGCAGDRLRRCDCERDRREALESAVDDARNPPSRGEMGIHRLHVA